MLFSSILVCVLVIQQHFDKYHRVLVNNDAAKTADVAAYAYSDYALTYCQLYKWLVLSSYCRCVSVLVYRNVYYWLWNHLSHCSYTGSQRGSSLL